MTNAAPETLIIVHRPEAARALVDPLRQRILAALEPADSAAGVARRIGMPRQQVNYHLRELERVGLVEPVEERRKGNCVEKVMRPVAHRFVVSAEALGAIGLAAAETKERYSWATLVGVAARAIRDLGLLSRRAQATSKKLPTLCLEAEVRLAAPRDLERFTADLATAIGDVVARHHDAKAKGGRRFRLFAGAHPAVDPPRAG